MTRKSDTQLLSVIIPVYRQEKTIRKNLQAILSELDQFDIRHEVIVVVDGSPDKSYEEAKKVHDASVLVVRYEKNRGKGYAVRYGMVRSKGGIVAFIDAGGEIRESGIPMLLEHMRWYNADIVLGSKRHPVSKVKYPIHRKLFSWGYQQLVRFLFGLNVSDTQVGLKVYRRNVIEDVLPRIGNDHFSFDIEMLAVAYHLGYRRIFESPIELDFSRFSSSITRGNTLKIIFRMLKDTLDIFYKLRIIHYYDAINGHMWQQDPDLVFSSRTPKTV